MGCICTREIINCDGRKFITREILGEGGFSTIYLVSDIRTNKQFAAKKIVCHSERDLKIAQQEVAYMKIFHHENLVPCIGHILLNKNDHKELYIVMPFYHSGSLYDYICKLKKCNRNMEEENVWHLFKKICLSFSELHSFKPHPLAHFDLKPQNVMLEKMDFNNFFNPILMDFGSMRVARCHINNIVEARNMKDFAEEFCTMPYRAPELFQLDIDSEITESVDIWSLGCLLYAMCFFESPFDCVQQRGDSIALAVIGGSYKIPENNCYSSNITDMIKSMLTVDPTARPTINEINSIINDNNWVADFENIS